jgi:hypothetical protein
VIFHGVSRQIPGEYLKISTPVTDRYKSCAGHGTSLTKVEVNNTHFYGIVILQILAQFFEAEVFF